jgi:hypothetical protein
MGRNVTERKERPGAPRTRRPSHMYAPPPRAWVWRGLGMGAGQQEWNDAKALHELWENPPSRGESPAPPRVCVCARAGWRAGGLAGWLA